MNNYIILRCQNVYFFTSIDAHIFFDWAQSISIVKKVMVLVDEIHIWIDRSNMHYFDLTKLVGLFRRYNIDTLPLRIFMNDENQSWFKFWVTKSLVKR